MYQSRVFQQNTDCLPALQLELHRNAPAVCFAYVCREQAKRGDGACQRTVMRLWKMRLSRAHAKLLVWRGYGRCCCEREVENRHRLHELESRHHGTLAILGTRSSLGKQAPVVGEQELESVEAMWLCFLVLADSNRGDLVHGLLHLARKNPPQAPGLTRNKARTATQAMTIPGETYMLRLVVPLRLSGAEAGGENGLSAVNGRCSSEPKSNKPWSG
jgi:hypothetical protein